MIHAETIRFFRTCPFRHYPRHCREQPGATAWDYFNTDYDGTELVGFSETYGSPYDSWQDCGGWDYDYYYEVEYCYLNYYHAPWVLVNGYIIVANNATPYLSAIDYFPTYDAWVPYDIPYPSNGTWYSAAEHWVGDDIYEQDCWGADPYNDCGQEYYLTWEYDLGRFVTVSDPPQNIQHLTYVTYNTPLVYVPGHCLSVSADPGIASVDFQYTWNGEFREEDGWPNGQASCLDVSQSQFFGSYQLLQAKSHADNAWAWVPAVGAVLLSLVEASPPQAVPTSFQILSVTTANNLNCGFLTQGFGAKVRYQVVDQFGSPVTASGMTPQEKVTIRGVEDPNFLPFSTPQTTGPDDSGQFDDVPIGTCFGPPLPSTNLCIRVFQKFNVVLDGTTYPIDTVTARTDCVQGIRVGTTPDDTTQLGTVN